MRKQTVFSAKRANKMRVIEPISVNLGPDPSRQEIQDGVKRLIDAVPLGRAIVRLPIPKGFLIGDSGYLKDGDVRIVRVYDPSTGRTFVRLDVGATCVQPQ